jgi:ABC-type lipoprotein release transport system permease subunit
MDAPQPASHLGALRSLAFHEPGQINNTASMNQLLRMALRDLGRNRRRSILSALAVSIGTALLLLMAAVVRGEMRGAMQNSIQLQSGHLQIRADSYDESKLSLAWEDLIANPTELIGQLQALPQIRSATPRLVATGILTLSDQSRGVQVVGIDPAAEANQIFRQGVISGKFLTTEDREGVLIGKPLAEKFNLKAGDRISLLINTSNGGVDEQPFVVRGIYSTNTSAYDEGTLFMPLAKAQAFSGAQDHASSIFILLRGQDQAEAVASAIRSSGHQILTWRSMNEMIVQFEDFAGAYMVILYLIVLGITATVVTNTLVMAVFERTREIGILSAIGMKSRRIMAGFLTEAALIATGGVLGGLMLGGLMVAYFSRFGFYIGDMGVTGILLGDTIYAYLTLEDAISLAIATYVITLAASLYPAVLAARLEPVEALHAH